MQMQTKTTKLTMLAMLSALAFVLMTIGRIPLMSIPGLTLNYDPKDIIIILCGFIYGPLSAAVVSVLVSAVEMVSVSDTGPIGMLMNVVSSCAIACTASLIYKYKRTFSGAVIGLAVGCVFTAFVMVLWNYLITPIYLEFPRAAVVPHLFTFFLPFNLIKGSINAAATIMIYKPASKILRSMVGVPWADEKSDGKNSLVITLASAAIIAACVGIVYIIN